MIAGWLSTGPTLSLPSFFSAPPTGSSIISPMRIVVVDGDTVRVGGRLTRLVGFNTPETYEPRCDAERQLGNRATRRLHELLASGPVEFVAVRCSCAPGTEGTDRCNYGRACGTLRVNGRDVGETLIAEGLAARFVCGWTGCPPTPRPWCAT